MRVAVCLSGLPRAVETCFPSIKEKILDPYQPDVFVHVWAADVEKQGEPIDYKKELKILQELYSPTEYKISYPTNSKLQEYLKSSGMNSSEILSVYRDKRRHCLSMYYSIWRANKLMIMYEDKYAFRYDQVFRLRTDISLRRIPVSFDDTIHIPNTLKQANTYEDIMAWGPSNAMNWYSTLYTDFYKYEPTCRRDSKTFWNSHVMLKMHLDRKKKEYPVTLVTKSGAYIDLRRRLQ